MERLGWEGSTNNICSWDIQQQETESFLVSDPTAFAYINCRLDSSGGLQKSKASKWNAQQCQEISKQAADSVPEKSGAFTGWSNASTGEMCSSSILNRTCIMNPLSGLMPDFGIANEAGIANGFQEAKAVLSTATGSLESLACLLSATNRNADASAEDNGISMIFSDCKRLWKIGAMDGASPGESACVGYSVKDANSHCLGNELDETISQASSDHETKINVTKRKNDQIPMKAAENCCYLDLVQADSSTTEGGFQLISENQPKHKKARSDKRPSSSNINFQQPSSSLSSMEEPDSEAIAQMKEMIYHAAAFRPVNLGMEEVEKTKRKNVRISNDPQTVAARQRRERISERIRVLQKLVPGGSKMDTASMLDEAANYLKFLRSQVKQLETLGSNIDSVDCPSRTNLPFSSVLFN